MPSQSSILARLAALDVDLQEANRQLKRVANLAKKNVASEQLLDEQQAEVNALIAEMNVLKTQMLALEVRAPFDGVLGKRGLSDDVLVSESSIILTLDDSSIILSDLKVPETYAPLMKKGLPIEATFSGQDNKVYLGEIDSVASRINADTRSLLVRIKIINNNFELMPGGLLEVSIKYDERNSLGVPDTGVIFEGNKMYVYKLIENDIVKKTEIETGIRSKGNLEVVSGLQSGDKIVAEGLGKTRPGAKIKPIINN